MTLPGSFNKVTVTGTYTTLTGELAKGKVTFTPDSRTWLTAVPEKVVIVPKTITADLTNGTFAVDLPATDDPDILPNGGTYVVTEVVGTDSRTYSIQVPVGSGPIDLATVAPVQPVTATSRLVTSVNGVKPNGAGNVALDVLALTGGTVTGPVTLQSSYPSDDVQGGIDGTSRLNLQSYQRGAFASFGETIRHYLMRKDAKAMEAWYFPQGGYDADRNPVGTFKPVVWAGAHWESNGHTGNHKHWSVETPDPTGAIQTRFEVRFGDTSVDNAIAGLGKTLIATNLADLVIRTTNNQELRLSSSTSWNKDIAFSTDHEGGAEFQRWRIRVTSTDSNFQLVRYSDTGTLQDAPLAISRATGKVSIGGSAGTAQGLDVLRNGGTTMNVTQSGAGTGLNLFGVDSAVRALQAQVTGDTSGRFVVMTTGEVQWGSGAAARDTNLYRSAADVLKTDDSFHVAAQFRHLGASLGFYNATAIAKPTVSGSLGANAALSSLVTALTSLGLITDSTVA